MAWGQGATEYLVLLAVVLIIALVAIALLGFFPGTASDAQMTESKLYWQSASPIAITEWNARVSADNGMTYLYLRFRNNAVYPIRITGLIGADGGKVTQFYGESPPVPSCNTPTVAYYNISDFFYLGPSEEQYVGLAAQGVICNREIRMRTGPSGSIDVGGATSVCQNSSVSPGNIELRNFGIEYVIYIEGQQITKRQMGAKPVIIKCLPPA